MAYQIKHELTPDQRAAVVEQMVGELHERLLGSNGQPGEIEKLHGRIKATNDRVAGVERWQERANGALLLTAKILVILGIIAAIVTAAAAWRHVGP